jgi:uncharacterized protein (TIGR02246 family)
MNRVKCLMIAVAMIVPTAAQASDAAANAVYDRMVAAYKAYDPAQLETVYAPDATYLSRSGRLDIHRRDQVRRGLTGYIQQLKTKGSKVDMKFRVVERKRFGDVYVDNGYVRTTVTPADGTAPQVTTGKFLTVLAKQPGGHWSFVSDADSETPAEAFDRAVRIGGVKFDQ